MKLWDYFDGLVFTEWIALWGALLSTVLAAIKIVEWQRDRERLEIDFSSTTNESIGNSIVIRNLYARPINITYWELFAAHDRRGKHGYQSIQSAEFDSGDQTIGANASIVWNFCDAYYFSTSEKALKGRVVYLKLCIAGRKPVTRSLYPHS